MRVLAPVTVALIALSPAWTRPSYGGQEGERVVASVAGEVLTENQLEKLVSADLALLRQQEYDLKMNALQSFVREKLIAREAAARGVEPQEMKRLIRDELKNKAQAAAAADPRLVPGGVIGSAEPPPGSAAGGGQARSMTDEYLSEENWRFMRDLRRKYGVRLNLDPPRIAVEAGDDPALGPPDARVTVVAFLDYECTPCAEEAAALRRLQQRFPKDVRVVVRDFPLASHPNSARAAQAAACAGEQGRFWEMHDRLFADQRKLQGEDLKAYARDLSLDGSRFAECLDGTRGTPEWRADRADGERFGVRGTPTVFVNGRLVPRGGGYIAVWSLVQDELDLLSSPAR